MEEGALSVASKGAIVFVSGESRRERASGIVKERGNQLG